VRRVDALAAHSELSTNNSPHQGPRPAPHQPRHFLLASALSGIRDRTHSAVSEWWKYRSRSEVRAHAPASRNADPSPWLERAQGHWPPRIERFYCVPAQEGRAEGASAIDTAFEVGTFHHGGRITKRIRSLVVGRRSAFRFLRTDGFPAVRRGGPCRG
jgi:hypothetical protein